MTIGWHSAASPIRYTAMALSASTTFTWVISNAFPKMSLTPLLSISGWMP